MAITCRKATHQDFGGIFALQEKYHIGRIPQEAISGGFVTTFLTEKNLLDVQADDGLFIALDGERVVGYVLAFSWEYARQWPIFDYMTTTFHTLFLAGTPVTTENSYQYGPVCVHEDYRGGRALLPLFDFQRQQVCHRYEFGATFINTANLRSMEAHVKKLGWTVIGGFEYNEKRYNSLAYPTRL